MGYLQLKSFTKFKETFGDLNETFFMEKEDRVELYSYITGVPHMFQFTLMKSDIDTDPETFVKFLRQSATELVDAR